MESSVNESINSSLSQFDWQISPYATYYMMSVLFLGAPIVIIPTSLVIYIIMKKEKLQTKKNYFLINLLITDIALALSKFIVNGILIFFYLFDGDVDPNCTVIKMLDLIPALANKLCFLPIIFDRLLCIAFPFDYKQIMTNKVVATTITILWLMTVCIAFGTVTNCTFLYIPPLGNCNALDNCTLLRILVAGPQLLTVLAIIITSIYFRYRIYKSKKFFERAHRNAVERRKALSAGKLLDKLQKELRSTLSVIIMGGVDALFNLFIPVTWSAGRLAFTQNPHIRRVYSQLIISLPNLCQSLSHSLTYGIYNKEIRKHLIEYWKKIFVKRSEVITLTGGAR